MKSEILCHLLFAVIIAAQVEDSNKTNYGECLLPPYPDNGYYTIKGVIDASPGQKLNAVDMTVACNPGFNLVGDKDIICFQGSWSDEMSQCLPYCLVEKQTIVVANEASRRCVLAPFILTSGCRPRLNSGYSECGMLHPDFLSAWDHHGLNEVAEGHTARNGELPWHAGIYETTIPYEQICGGSIISKSVIISAAHCFWDDLSKQLPASQFAVGVGKLNRPYDDDHDSHAQTTYVKEIKIPPHFQGGATNFQDDIAVVFVTNEFTFNYNVMPVCLDFNDRLDSQQLQPGNFGKVGGWGLTKEEGDPSPVLQIANMPYITVEQCMADSTLSFWSSITSDKFCAGYKNGTALCKGDSGGGLAFAEVDNGRPRFFLRGIVSTAPKSQATCNAWTWSTFTHVIKHERFIKNALPEDSFSAAAD